VITHHRPLCPCALVLYCVEESLAGATVYHHHDVNGELFYYVRPPDTPYDVVYVGVDCPIIQNGKFNYQKSLLRRKR